jgi:hypothetical protein
MRRVVFAVVVAALAGAAPAWGAGITLVSDHSVARHGDSVRLRGTLPTPEPQQVVLLRDGVAMRSTVAAGGAFFFDVRLRKPGSFVVRTAAGESAAVSLRLRPRLESRLVGRRRIGHRVLVVGRLLPARAGKLVLGRVRVRVGARGRFRARVSTSRPRFAGRLRLRPAPRYVAVARRVRLRLALPPLRLARTGRRSGR